MLFCEAGPRVASTAEAKKEGGEAGYAAMAVAAIDESAGAVRQRPNECTVNVALEACDWSVSAIVRETLAVLSSMGIGVSAADDMGGVFRGVVQRNTWVGSRRARRDAARHAHASAAITTGQMNTTVGPDSAVDASALPLFCFNILTAVDSAGGGKVLLRLHGINALDTAQQFGALFKQRLQSAARKRSINIEQ